MDDMSAGTSWHPAIQISCKGNPDALSREEDPNLTSWRRVAVFTAGHRGGGVWRPFRIGFVGPGAPNPWFQDEPVDDLMFGLRLGPEDVTFLFLPSSEGLWVRHTETVDIDDPRYRDLPLY